VPELDFAILCEAAHATQGLLFVHAGCFDQITGAVGTHQVAVAFRLLFTSGECDRPHSMDVIAQDEDGQRLATVTNVVVPHIPDDLVAGTKVKVLVTMRIPLQIQRYGRYSLEILADNVSLKTLPLRFAPPTG